MCKYLVFINIGFKCILFRIICGSIVVKTDIACIRGKDVEFIDGTTTKDIDIIITATGYKFGFSYLDKEVSIF